ncbi:MAG: DUF2505 domain-containing protein [Nocardioidaceae bacterium]|nr:DUF2505 domain-containing protein [Nocardioidaceae bacterium]
MATRLSHELTYEASLDAVSAMLADPAFREEVCRHQHAVTFSVAVEGEADAPQVRIESTQATDRVPAFAKKFIGETTTIVWSESWSRPRRAEVSIAIPGKPGEIRGTATLDEVDGVTTETVDLQIKVKIPLVAGKIEELLAKLMRSALRAEHRAGQAWLTR